jgi:hypothetical protein
MMAFAARPDPVGDFIRANLWWVVPLFVASVWWVSLHFAAWLTGWSELAARYRTDAPFQGERWNFQSAQTRYMSHYNGCLTFGANPQGMYVAPLIFFRIGHPALLVPWQELRIEPQRKWLVAGYELRFAQVPGVFLWIRKSLGDRILATSKAGGGFVTAPPIG